MESDATVVVLCPQITGSRAANVASASWIGGQAGAVDREVAPGGVAQVGFCVAVVAGGDGADAGVRAVGVGDEQQALPQHGALQRFA